MTIGEPVPVRTKGPTWTPTEDGTGCSAKIENLFVRLEGHDDGRQNDDLVPGRKDSSGQWFKGTSLELKCDSATAVDQHVEPIGKTYPQPKNHATRAISRSIYLG